MKSCYYALQNSLVTRSACNIVLLEPFGMYYYPTWNSLICTNVFYETIWYVRLSYVGQFGIWSCPPWENVVCAIMLHRAIWKCTFVLHEVIWYALYSTTWSNFGTCNWATRWKLVCANLHASVLFTAFVTCCNEHWSLCFSCRGQGISCCNGALAKHVNVGQANTHTRGTVHVLRIWIMCALVTPLL